MKTKIAMRERGLRYFSTLTEKQRRESLLMMNKITHQLLDIPDGLVTSIIFGAGLNFVDLSGCKMFCHKGTNIWYPLNFNEVIKETKTRK